VIFSQSLEMGLHCAGNLAGVRYSEEVIHHAGVMFGLPRQAMHRILSRVDLSVAENLDYLCRAGYRKVLNGLWRHTSVDQRGFRFEMMNKCRF